jgi:transcriptional regulator with XRE-family HTH domain
MAIELRLARQIARLTQKQLAELAGVDDSAISAVETGRSDIRSMGYASVVRIARALNAKAEDLWPVDDVTTDGAARPKGPMPATETEPPPADASRSAKA